MIQKLSTYKMELQISYRICTEVQTASDLWRKAQGNRRNTQEIM